MSECISVHVGQTGVQMGQACWELFCLEHGIQHDGTPEPGHNTAAGSGNDSVTNFFRETEDGKMTSRAVFVDVEQDSLDKVRKGALGNFFPEDCFKSRSDCYTGHLYTRGLHTDGKEVLDNLLDGIRKEAEACSSLKGVLVYHGVGGGTGSGLTSLLLYVLESEGGIKTTQAQVAVYPGPNSNTVVAPYNAVMSTFDSLTVADCSLVLNNQRLRDICASNLGVYSPSHAQVNALIAQIVSAATSSMRFGGEVNSDLTQLSRDLAPFPRMPFVMASYSPFLPQDGTAGQQHLGATELVNSCLDVTHRSVNCDLGGSSRYLANCFMGRGDLTRSEVQVAIDRAKVTHRLELMDWCKGDIQVGLNPQSPRVVPGGDMSETGSAMCMLSNSTAFRQVLKPLCREFDLMFDKRSHLHHFINDRAAFESEMVQAREGLASLQEDYEEMEKCSYAHGLAA